MGPWRLTRWIGRLAERRRSDRAARVPQQVTRLLLLFVAAGTALMVGRHYLIPPTFGQIGHYRAAAIDEALALEPKYASRELCGDCHWDVFEVHSQARHQTVSCETCHGAGYAHMDDPSEVQLFFPRERDFCPRCHSYDPARPTGFPQIDPIAHNPIKGCVTCHNPHEPVPPDLPASCAACHGEIARLKAASHHAALPCTQCHETSDEHKDTPRLSTPSKPQTREFCGGCHAPDAASAPEIPRVELETHSGRYLCWQCHYPHYPEVR